MTETIPKCMRHLPQAEGLPIPAHTDAATTGEAMFASISPLRYLLFLGSMRCNLCAGQISAKGDEIKAGIVVTPGDVQPTATDRHELIQMAEGIMHPHCLQYAGAVCPALGNPDWVTRTPSNVEWDNKKVGLRRGVSWFCVSPYATVSVNDGFPKSFLGGPISSFALPELGRITWAEPTSDAIARRLVKATEVDLAVGAAVFLELVPAGGRREQAAAAAAALRNAPNRDIGHLIASEMLTGLVVPDKNPDGTPNMMPADVRAAIADF